MPGPAAPAAPTAAAPNPLAPLTSQQITKQATSTINKAYAPAYQSLGQQTKTAQGLSDKRSADNKYYQTWLNTQSAALQSHADAAHAQLAGLEQNLQNQQSTLYAAQPGQLVAGANARAGNVSNNAQSNAFGADLNANQDANMGLLHNSEQAANSAMENQTGMLGAVRANNTALIQGAESKRISDLNLAMTGIANARAKLDTSHTGDIAKEIARLQGVEISKAQSNRAYDAAAQKLGITAANTQSEINTRAGQLKIGAMNAATALTRAQNSQMNSDRNYNLNVQKYNSATAKDIYLRDHGLGPYRVSRGSGPKPLSQGSQNVIYSHIDKTVGLLENLINNHHLTPVQAYHVLQHGSTGQIDASPPTTSSTGVVTHHYLTIQPTGYGTQILNAAYNARSGGSGLSPGDIAALTKLGLQNPQKRYGASVRGGGRATQGAANAVSRGAGAVGNAIGNIL